MQEQVTNQATENVVEQQQQPVFDPVESWVNSPNTIIVPNNIPVSSGDKNVIESYFHQFVAPGVKVDIDLENLLLNVSVPENWTEDDAVKSAIADGHKVWFEMNKSSAEFTIIKTDAAQENVEQTIGAINAQPTVGVAGIADGFITYQFKAQFVEGDSLTEAGPEILNRYKTKDFDLQINSGLSEEEMLNTLRKLQLFAGVCDFDFQNINWDDVRMNYNTLCVQNLEQMRSRVVQLMFKQHNGKEIPDEIYEQAFASINEFTGNLGLKLNYNASRSDTNEEYIGRFNQVILACVDCMTVINTIMDGLKIAVLHTQSNQMIQALKAQNEETEGIDSVDAMSFAETETKPTID